MGIRAPFEAAALMGAILDIPTEAAREALSQNPRAAVAHGAARRAMAGLRAGGIAGLGASIGAGSQLSSPGGQQGLTSPLQGGAAHGLASAAALNSAALASAAAAAAAGAGDAGAGQGKEGGAVAGNKRKQRGQRGRRRGDPLPVAPILLSEGVVGPGGERNVSSRMDVG